MARPGNTPLQSYDWKGRPAQTTNFDGTTKILLYGGCGCAGGEVITVQDEHGRQRRLTKDSLGRQSKVEELNWNGTVYATTNYTVNVRDQIAEINQAGQSRTFNYDGYGRLSSRLTPEQGTTSYNYNVDDTVNFVTDARGAKTIFGYNPRHLVTGLTYDLSNLVQGQSVAATPNVVFTYDAAGNRQSMTDGSGSTTYTYNNLSQLTSETRGLNGPNYTLSYTVSYSYNLVGELASLTNPLGTLVNYAYDKIGRLTGATGAAGANPSTYAGSITYRAFGAIKGMSYGDGRGLSTTYDSRMRTTKWDVSNVLGYNYNYDYLNEHTGRVTLASSIMDPTLDRSYEYDNVGRLAISHSGAEARAHVGTGQWGTMDGPYSQGYDYDLWGNVTHKYGWGGEVQGGTAGQTSDIYYTYAGNRRNGFSYDASGNLTNDLGQTFTYDATGQQATASYGGYSLQQSYDGDGLRVKKNDNGTITYYVRSSVLGGQVLAEIYASGVVKRTYTYLGNQLLSLRNTGEKGNGAYWIHEDPITKSKRVTNSLGTVVSTVELDPWGADTARSSNVAFQPRKFTSYDRDGNGSDEAMFRRSNRWHSRFDQPDPYDGSYDSTDPQSFNRYAYVQNDPVNFVDPSGLDGPSAIGLPLPFLHGPGAYTVTVPISFNNPITGGGYGGGGRRELLEEVPTEFGGGGDGDPQKTGVSIERLKSAIDFCLGMFGMSLTSFNPSAKGKDGSATMNFTDGRTINGFSGFGVVNDVNTYSQKELQAVYKQQTGKDISGLLGLTIPGTLNGLSFDPHTNYTINNLYGTTGTRLNALVGTQLAVQVHELGNSISSITGIQLSSYPKNEDQDAGRAFENCVGKNY